ncbi:MAG: NlpC/P60 family protein [Desulforhopalus sp.]
MNKGTVTYIPPEDRNRPNPEQLDYEERIETLTNHFLTWQGTRYRYGGLSRKGVDCSGFTLLTYKELFGKSLPRTVREQVQKGVPVPRSSLQPGDLVFFRTGVIQKHVGIYLENNRFMHASRSRGVMISRIDDTYWRKRFWQAKRI